MDKIEKAYLDLILEAQYDDDKWQRYGKYQGIEIYYSIEHVKNRINKRYKNNGSNVFKQLRICVNVFLKGVLKDKILENRKGDELSFTIHCTLSNIWFSGRFKRNNNIWRIQISTLLPSKDNNGNNITPKFSANDYRKDVYA